MAVPRTYMDRMKVYVLIGGLGGFGLELASWLVLRGAKKLVITSRRGVTTGYQSLCLKRLHDADAKVVVSRLDASTSKGAESLIYLAEQLGPLGGIFNVALVLRDGLLKDLNRSDFELVAAPKIEATRHLDVATRDSIHLDHFVVFSSVASGHGNEGQTNYGYANSTMEQIIEFRRTLGLPGLAIQWGAVGDVGILIDTMGKTNAMEFAGTLPQRIRSCLGVFDIFLRQSCAVISSYVRTKKIKALEKSSPLDVVLNILGFKDIKIVPQTTSLPDLGMDSLMVTEIKHTLEREFDMVLDSKEIRTLTFARLAELSHLQKK